MIEAILCDQYGIEFKEEEIPESKEFKKICFKKNNNVYVKLDENKIEIFSGPTDDTNMVKSHIRDNKGEIKVTDIFIVKSF